MKNITENKFCCCAKPHNSIDQRVSDDQGDLSCEGSTLLIHLTTAATDNALRVDDIVQPHPSLHHLIVHV